MKKTKFLALSLVVAFAFTGTAFAYWGQDIASSTTVNTGKLEVKIVKASTLGILEKGPNATATDDKGDFRSWVIDDNRCNDENYYGVDKQIRDQHKDTEIQGDTVVAKLANMYPGSKVEITYKVQNTGSIPIKVADVTPTFPAGIGEFFNVGIKGDGFDTGVVDQSTLSTKLKSVLSNKAKCIDPSQETEITVTLDFSKNIANIGAEQFESLKVNNEFIVKTNFTQWNAK